LKEKKLRKDLEILDRENKPPAPAPLMSAGLMKEKKKLPDNVTAEQNDRENLLIEQKKYLKVISSLREELCFKHYVGVRLYNSGGDLAKILKIKGLLVEKFQLLCAQAVRHACKILIIDLAEKEKNKKEVFTVNKELKNLQKVLEKELKFYQELHEDLLKHYKSLNVYESLKNDKEIEHLLEGELCEKGKEILGGYIRRYGFEILKVMTNNEVEIGEKEREIVISFDYLLDFMACLIRNGNKHEVDYESLHREKSENGEVKMYWEKVCGKKNALVKREN